MADSFPTLTKHDLDRVIRVCGGAGSGNFGHKGRPGKVGGSGPGGSAKAKESYSSGQFGRVRDMLFKKGGFSYQPALDKFATKTGYMISPYESRSRIIPKGEVTNEDFVDFATDNADLLQDTGKYFGGWVGENDEVFFDVSIKVDSAAEANALAVKHKQRAYWDLKRNIEVKTVWPEGQEPEFHD